MLRQRKQLQRVIIMISVIITTFNEGEWLAKTVESVRQMTSDYELIIVDDGGTDGSCEQVTGATVVRHDQRIGIAASRRDGIAAAKGDCYAFLDAHQLLTEGCLNWCAEVALDRQAIVCPCTRGPKDRMQKNGTVWTGHGSVMRQQPNGLFVGQWRNGQPRDKLSRCSMMVVPGYVIPASVYPKVAWLPQLRHWGGSEPCITVQAFFADVDVLHLCGPIARHLFRGKIQEDGKTKIDRPFHPPFSATWRNHAHTARMCFDDETWTRYWWPEVFAKWADHGNAEGEFYSPEVMAQHAKFRSYKQRPDEEFWLGLMGKDLPERVKHKRGVRNAG